ncbi:hypothetical protein JTE90_011606 [Oedothorax gibbosus]|uniref:WAP domain-containing protein n=1 Tax=Oedothorax gibbosus TaxID=931172 RepID=A0AAV6TUH7_9ARAC|nr:hypothetical protein JTE90_011606 [Oedothorax gibbosus]
MVLQNITMKTTVIIFLVIALAVTVHAGLYCPMKPDIACATTGNTCCNDGDCKDGDFCCKEACGAVCKRPAEEETDGEKYDQNPEVCQKGVFTNF